MRLLPFLILLCVCACTSKPESTLTSADSATVVNDSSQPDGIIKVVPTAPPVSIVKDSTVLDQWRVYTDVYHTNYANPKNNLLILPKDESFVSYDGYQHIAFDSLIYFKGNDGAQQAIAVWHTVVYEEEDQPRSCHSCGASMGLALYRKFENKVWRMQKSRSDIEDFGSYGNLPSFELQQAAPGKFMFVLQPGFTGQGVTYENEVFFELTALEECFSLDTHEDNYGMIPEEEPGSYSWDATYKWLPKGDSIVLEVTTKGQVPEDKKVGKVIYVWDATTRKLKEQ